MSAIDETKKMNEVVNQRVDGYRPAANKRKGNADESKNTAPGRSQEASERVVHVQRK